MPQSDWVDYGMWTIYTISLITGWTVYTEKYKDRGPDVYTDRREVYTKDRGIYIFRIDSPTSY